MTEKQILAALALFPASIATLFSVFVTVGAWIWFARSYAHDSTDALIAAAVGTIVSSAFLALSAALVLRIAGVI